MPPPEERDERLEVLSEALAHLVRRQRELEERVRALESPDVGEPAPEPVVTPPPLPPDISTATPGFCASRDCRHRLRPPRSKPRSASTGSTASPSSRSCWARPSCSNTASTTTGSDPARAWLWASPPQSFRCLRATGCGAADKPSSRRESSDWAWRCCICRSTPPRASINCCRRASHSSRCAASQRARPD